MGVPRGFVRLYLFACFCGAVAIVGCITHDGLAGLRSVALDIGCPLVVWLFVLRARRSRDELLPWSLFAAAYSAFEIGDILWPEPNGGREQLAAHWLALVAWSGTPLFLAAGLVLLARRRLSGSGRTVWLDGLMVGTVAGAIDIAFLVDHAPRGQLFAWEVVAPLPDVLLLGLAVAVMAASGWWVDRTWLLVSVAAGGEAMSDSMFFHYFEHDEFRAFTGVSIGYVLVAVVLCAAVLVQPQARTRARADDWRVSILPAVAVALALALLLDRPRSDLVVGLAAATIGISVVRTFVTFAELRHLDGLRTQVVSDQLTGVLNRRGYDAALARWGSSETSRFALLTIDLDGFKHINDTFGHHVGDELLECVAQRISARVRKSDVVARPGGDEFAVLAAFGNAADAERLAADLYTIITKPYEFATATVAIGVSIGIAVPDGDPTDTQRLRRQSDAAMYQVKANGGGYSFAVV